MADNLDLPQVTPGQNDKEITINDATKKNSDASNEYKSIAMSDANYVLTASDQQENAFLEFTGSLTAARNIDLLASKKRQMKLKNSTSGGFDLVARYAAGGGTVDIPAGEVRTIQATGANVIEAGGGSGGGGGGGISGLSPEVDGALVYVNTASQTFSDSASQDVQFQAVAYDTHNIYNAGNPTELVVPTGAVKIRVSAGLQFGSNINSNYLRITRDGSASYIGAAQQRMNPATAATTGYFSATTGIIPAVAGQVFEVLALADTTGGTTTLATSGQSWFAMEIIEWETPTIQRAEAQTTDATVTTIWSLPLAAGEGATVRAQCTATKDTGDEAYTHFIETGALNQTGTLQALAGIGPATTAGSFGSPSVTGFSWNLNSTTDEIELQWQGDTGETWDVVAAMTVTKV